MKKYHFRRKMIWMNLLMIVGLIVVLCGGAYGYLVKISRENFKKQLEIEASGIMSGIRNSVDMADEIALQIAANNYVISTFQEIPQVYGRDNYFIDNQAADSRLKKLMLSYILKANSVGRVCLFDNNKDFTFVGNAVDYGYLEKNCLDGRFMQHIENRFEEGHAVLYENYGQDPFSAAEGGFFSVTREIKDYLVIPSKAIGYVQAQLPLKYFRKIFESVHESMAGCIVEESSGETIFFYGDLEGDEGVVKKMLADWSEGKSGEREELFRRNHYYGMMKEIPEYRLFLLVVERSDILWKYAVTTLLWMLLLIGGIVFLVVVGQTAIIRRSTKPIAELCELVENIEVDENLMEIPTIVSREDDELRKLNYAFSGLVKNLKWSMERYMASQLNELQAHMFALQSQMNPHFIHNILTIVSTMATKEEYERIPPVCERLSEMIRYSTSYEESYADMTKELCHARNYLELMKLRYEDKFQYNVSCLKNEFPFLVPKFIFQPLLENCFAHGFKTKAFPWQLEMMIYGDDDSWRLTIQDNGIGVAQERLRAIRDRIREVRDTPAKELMKRLKIGGLSLTNICARLFIAYGEAMVFEVDGVENGGFQIRIGGGRMDAGQDRRRKS